jgi:hypothetical protein
MSETDILKKWSDLLEQRAEEHIKIGWKAHWGDGAIWSNDLIILMRQPSEHANKVHAQSYNFSRDYVILSNHRTVYIYDSSGYAS